MGRGYRGVQDGDQQVGIDWKRQNIGDKGWTQPDFLREF